jgi:hypothetical protein
VLLSFRHRDEMVSSRSNIHKDCAVSSGNQEINIDDEGKRKQQVAYTRSSVWSKTDIVGCFDWVARMCVALIGQIN